jgi:branched-chain amino acid transport system permease protein
VSRGWAAISDDSPSEDATEASADTVAESSATRWSSWPVQYARDHLVHLVVVLGFFVYPGAYHLATTLPSGLVIPLIDVPLALVFQSFLPQVTTMTPILYFGLFAMSFDFISGYTGYLSFGHAAFYGIGAYLVILVANGKIPLLASSTPFMVTIVLAAILAALIAVAIGLVSFRLTGVYFAMITLGFAQVFYVFIRGWDWVSTTPRDGVGVSFETHPEGFQIGIPFLDSANYAIGRLTGSSIDNFLGMFDLSTTVVSFYMIGLVVLVCYLLMQRIVHSPFGRVMIAIRENEERARAVGYNTFYYKLAAFAISGAFAGVAGALFAGYRRSVTPENTFYFLTTGDALLSSIIGGLGTLAGPLYGRLFEQGLAEFLSKGSEGGGLLPLLQEVLSDAVLGTNVLGLTIEEMIDVFINGRASLYVGIVFVLFVLFVPDGLLGTLRDRLGGHIAKVVPDRLFGGERP